MATKLFRGCRRVCDVILVGVAGESGEVKQIRGTVKTAKTVTTNTFPIYICMFNAGEVSNSDKEKERGKR